MKNVTKKITKVLLMLTIILSFTIIVSGRADASDWVKSKTVTVQGTKGYQIENRYYLNLKKADTITVTVEILSVGKDNASVYFYDPTLRTEKNITISGKEMKKGTKKSISISKKMIFASYAEKKIPLELQTCGNVKVKCTIKAASKQRIINLKRNGSDRETIKDEKTKVKLGKKLNVFLSNVYEYGVREYDFDDYDLQSLMMNIAYRIPSGMYKSDGKHSYWIVKYDDVNDILYKYFRLSAPRKQIGDIQYRNGKFYFPMVDFGELGMPLLIANHVKQIGDKYKVTFDIAWIWPENFETGEENPVQDWSLYYEYNKDKLMHDNFCEIIGHGSAVVEINEGDLSILHFRSYTNNR